MVQKTTGHWLIQGHLRFRLRALSKRPLFRGLFFPNSNFRSLVLKAHSIGQPFPCGPLFRVALRLPFPELRPWTRISFPWEFLLGPSSSSCFHQNFQLNCFLPYSGALNKASFFLFSTIWDSKAGIPKVGFGQPQGNFPNWALVNPSLVCRN